MKKLVPQDMFIKPICHKTSEQKEYEMKLEHVKLRLKEYAVEQRAMAKFDFHIALKKNRGLVYAKKRHDVRMMIAKQLMHFVRTLFAEIDLIKYIEVQD